MDEAAPIKSWKLLYVSLFLCFPDRGYIPNQTEMIFQYFPISKNHTGCALCVLGVIASAGRDLGIIDGWGDGNKGMGQAQPFFGGIS